MVPNDDTTPRWWNVHKFVNNWRHSSGKIYLHVIFFEIQVFFSLRGVHCSKLSVNYDQTSTRKSEKAYCYYWEEYCRFRLIKRESFSEYCMRLFLHPPFSYCFLRLQGYAYAANDVTEVMRYKSKAILYRFIALRHASSKAMQMMFSLYSTRDTRMLQMMTAIISIDCFWKTWLSGWTLHCIL